MKQILLSFIISFPLCIYSMENPTTSAPTTTPAPSSVSADRFIDYMNQACAWADKNSKVQFCTYTLLWAINEGNNQIFDTALYYWNHWKSKSIEDFTRTELACPFVSAASKGYWYGAQKLLERSKGQIINDSCKAHKPNECCAVETSALAIAAKYGHSQFISSLLAYASDTPLNPDQIVNKKTALMEAIENDKLACTQALLQGKLKKASPSIQLPDRSFGSVLHWALSLGNRNHHVKILLDHGIDKNLIQKGKEFAQEGTPLMVAVAFANEQGVKMLLEFGADISIKHPFNKQTALELAELKVKVQQSTERLNIVNFIKLASAKQSGTTPGAV